MEFDKKIATQAALAESERMYRDLVRMLPAAVYMCDAAGRITLYNEAAAALWDRAPVIGETMWCGSYRMRRPDGSDLPLDQCRWPSRSRNDGR